jgi:type IV pilus assembly protein PilN
MPRINLLPWRETLKKERELRFGILTGVSLVVTGLIALAVHLYMAGLISFQQERNGFVEAEIKKVEAQIEEIKQVEEEKRHLIDRMNAIQGLETGRPNVVHLFDEIVKTIPDGVFYTDFRQDGEKLTFKGFAQSDARVSSLMTNIEKLCDENEEKKRTEAKQFSRCWMKEPRIQIIRAEERETGKGGPASTSNKRSVSSFTLNVTSVKPSGGDEKATDKAKKAPATPAAASTPPPAAPPAKAK